MSLLSLFFFTFLAGVVVGNIWLVAGAWIIGLLIVVLCFWKWQKWWIFFVCILTLIGGYLFATITLQSYEHKRSEIGTAVGWDGHQRSITGITGELLGTTEFNHKYRVTVATIDEQTVEPFDISLSLPPNLSLVTGDFINAIGTFSFPRDTPDYAGEKQLWNRGIIAEFRSFQIQKTPPKQYSFFIHLRQWFNATLAEIFPRQGHDLLSGILLGQRTTMDGTMRDELKASGLMHLMVVSGGNVIMLIVFLSLFIRHFHPWIRIAIVACTIGAFALLVGGDAPVWRAALMGVIGYAGSLWGQQFPRFFLPLGVACILAILNPLSIVYDIGLQLSFLSVLCIIAWGKSLTHFFRFLGSFFAEAMAMTIAATVGTLPITLFYFGTFSLIGPIANLFAAPAIPILMYGGIATLAVYPLSPGLGHIIGYIPWVASTYLHAVIHIFGSQAWSMLSVDLGQIRGYFLATLLALLCLSMLRGKLQAKRKN